MQRNRAHSNPLTPFILPAVFVAYEALAMRYLFLPPLFGLLFYFYVRALDTQNTLLFFQIILMLLIAEAAKGYWIFSTVIFYGLSYFVLLPRLRNAVSCRVCINFTIVAYGYLGLWAFLTILSQMFALDAPHLDWREIFYIAIEFALIGLL